MSLTWKSRDPKLLKHWIDVIIDEASDELYDWEWSFMDSIEIYLDKRTLTEAQEDKLEQIYVKHTS